jgi:hypothetical protein
MPALTLKSLISPRSDSRPALTALINSVGAQISIVDLAGKPLLGDLSSENSADHSRIPVLFEDATLGFVLGPAEPAAAIALLLQHFANRQCEGSGMLQRAASFGDSCGDSADDSGPLGPASGFAASTLERGIGEIVNNCASDSRALRSECTLKALMCAPLRAGQRTVGVIALASSAAGSSYSTADLKLLNTIALQTAAAIENSMLCEEMVETARERAALAAELQAASTVQQLLLQSASRPTPGFQVDSVYLPASEVGGDFFFVSPAPDGSLTAIVGDVSGKGLPAAMRVAMILGALRRETSHDPGHILAGLNNALMAHGQLGFTTASCVRISLSGEYTIANAGHISPYISGREVNTPPALPLGLVADQTYELVHGHLAASERLVLLSDGVPEARADNGELYGFDRLPSLTLMSARDIAEVAQHFGQEDDITVLTLAIAKN